MKRLALVLALMLGLVAAPAVANAGKGGPKGQQAKMLNQVAALEADPMWVDWDTSNLVFGGHADLYVALPGVDVPSNSRIFVRVVCAATVPTDYPSGTLQMHGAYYVAWYGENYADPFIHHVVEFKDYSGQGLEWHGEPATCSASLTTYDTTGNPDQYYEHSILQTIRFDVAAAPE